MSRDWLFAPKTNEELRFVLGLKWTCYVSFHKDKSPTPQDHVHKASLFLAFQLPFLHTRHDLSARHFMKQEQYFAANKKQKIWANGNNQTQEMKEPKNELDISVVLEGKESGCVVQEIGGKGK